MHSLSNIVGGKSLCNLNITETKSLFEFYFRVVEFASFSDMKNAIDKLDDTDLNGRRIKLVEDKSRRRR